ncbi:MAG: hypothetical protein ACOVRM_14175, partial [Planctomycetaceae bacterium]
ALPGYTGSAGASPSQVYRLGTRTSFYVEPENDGFPVMRRRKAVANTLFVGDDKAVHPRPVR